MAKLNIGQRLRHARQALGYMQQELAHKIGVTQAAISNIETDASRKPSAPTLLKIAAALEISPTWLLEGEGDMRVSPPVVDSAETELLTLFRRLDAASRSALLAAARVMAR